LLKGALKDPRLKTCPKLTKKMTKWDPKPGPKLRNLGTTGLLIGFLIGTPGIFWE